MTRRLLVSSSLLAFSGARISDLRVEQGGHADGSFELVRAGAISRLKGKALALGFLLLAMTVSASSARADTESDPTLGVAAHYVVFELDANSAPRPMSHRIVRLAGPLESRSDVAVERRIAATPGDVEQVIVRLFSTGGVVTFQDLVEIPRSMNPEHSLHDASRSSSEALIPQKAFVVRIPAGIGSRLRLSMARGRVEEAPVDFDLTSMAGDQRLPLAKFARQAQQEAPPPNSGNRVDLLVMGDGYMASEQAKFNADSANMVAGFFSLTPYKEYQSFVNVGTLFTPSAQSGADHPPYSSSCGPTTLPTCCGDVAMQGDPLRGTFVSTAFDATFCSFNIHRLLVVNMAKVFTAAAAYPNWDKILVVVNDSTYGGSGGSIGIASTNPAALFIAQHEYGHSFTRLADEYSDPFPGYASCSDLAGQAKCEPNVTDQTARSLIKWNGWLLPSTPVPTPGTDASIVGLFQGARFLAAGMYRPQFNCLMKALDSPFCRICAEAYVLRLYSGGWGIPIGGIHNIEPGSENPLPGTLVLSLPVNLPFSVGLLQPTANTVSALWTVNGVAAASGSAFTLRATTAGAYLVQIKTHDATPLVDAAKADGPLDGVRTWTIQATGTGSGSPSAGFTFSPSAPAAGQSIQFSDTSSGATSWSWTFGNGGASTSRNPVNVFQTPGTYAVQLTVSDGTSWSTAFRSVTVGPQIPGVASTLTVPIVLSTSGLNGSFFTSEMSLTNRGSMAAGVSYSYTAAFGGSSGTATDSIPPGRQNIVSDAVGYLSARGIPLGDSGNRGGTLRVTFTGLSSADAGAATVRTTTPVAEGRAGLAYSGLSATRLLSAPVYLCGLRQNATDRSNVAVINAGGQSDGSITLRLTVFSGDPANPGTHVLPDITLSPGGFNQVSGILTSNGLVLTNGYVKVERVSGSAAFYAYAVINDQANSDGSFVEPVLASAASPITGVTLPVVVETSAFSTELVLTNFSSIARTVRCTYVAAALPGGSVPFSISLLPNEQQILPTVVRILRERGVFAGAPGPTFAGALFAADATGDLRGIAIGARTSAAGGGGQYGLYYSAVPAGSEATTSAWLYGLQQNSENRTNLALINVGSTDSSPDVFRVDLYDGATGQNASTIDNISVPAKGFLQINTILAQYAPSVTGGYALVTRISGTNPFITYAVVNDGGQPGQRSGDGAFISASIPTGP